MPKTARRQRRGCSRRQQSSCLVAADVAVVASEATRLNKWRRLRSKAEYLEPRRLLANVNPYSPLPNRQADVNSPSVTGAAKTSEFFKAVESCWGTSASSLLIEACWGRVERAAAAVSVDTAALIDAALRPKDARGANAADATRWTRLKRRWRRRWCRRWCRLRPARAFFLAPPCATFSCGSPLVRGARYLR